MALRGRAQRAIQHGVDTLTPFQVGNVSGCTLTPFSEVDGYTVGALPYSVAVGFHEAVHSNKIAYAIYSYDTPIAWLTTAGTWVVPDIKYSVTTSNHQSVVRAAIATRRTLWISPT